MNYPNLSKVQSLIKDYGDEHRNRLIRRLGLTLFLVFCVAGDILSIPNHPNLSFTFRFGWLTTVFLLAVSNMFQLSTFQANKSAWRELNNLMGVAGDRDFLIDKLLKPMVEIGFLCEPIADTRNALIDCLIDRLRHPSKERIDQLEFFLRSQPETVKSAVRKRCLEITEEATVSLQGLTSRPRQPGVTMSFGEIEKPTKTLQAMEYIQGLIAAPKPLEWKPILEGVMVHDSEPHN